MISAKCAGEFARKGGASDNYFEDIILDATTDGQTSIFVDYDDFDGERIGLGVRKKLERLGYKIIEKSKLANCYDCNGCVIKESVCKHCNRGARNSRYSENVKDCLKPVTVYSYEIKW